MVFHLNEIFIVILFLRYFNKKEQKHLNFKMLCCNFPKTFLFVNYPSCDVDNLYVKEST